MDDQKLLPSPIPWYRTRWFWGIVIGAAVLWGITSFYFFFSTGRDSSSELYENLVLSFGAGYFGLFGGILFRSVGSYIFTFMYFILMFFLGFETLKRPRVNLVYPTTLVSLFISGTLFTYYFLAGLS